MDSPNRVRFHTHRPCQTRECRHCQTPRNAPLPDVRERLEIGRALGFREFQLSLPSFGALNNHELDAFARETLGAYPDCRFLFYNTARGLRVLNGAELGRLAAAYPNLVATKSGGHTVASLLALFEACPDLCHFITELDYASACLLGHPTGLLVSVSSIHLPRSRQFFAAGQQGDLGTLRHMLGELTAIRHQVLATVAQSGGHMDGAYDKLYARLTDPAFPLDLLPPYQGAGVADFERFRDWLSTHHPAWVLPHEST